MKFYKKLIKPMLSFQRFNRTPKYVPIGPGEKWYPEEEREKLIKKYKHLETTVKRIVFGERFEEVSVYVQVINALQTPVSVSRTVIKTETDVTTVVKLKEVHEDDIKSEGNTYGL